MTAQMIRMIDKCIEAVSVEHEGNFDASDNGGDESRHCGVSTQARTHRRDGICFRQLEYASLSRFRQFPVSVLMQRRSEITGVGARHDWQNLFRHSYGHQPGPGAQSGTATKNS